MRILKQKLKEILKGGSNSFFSLLGLVIGVSSFAIVCIWTYYQLSYDRHFEDLEQIHLVAYTDTVYGDKDVVMPFPMAQFMRHHFPEMALTSTFTLWPDKEQLKVGNAIFYEAIHLAEKQILDILRFQFLESNGSPFSSPNDIIISQSIAHKLFGRVSCIGQSILLADSLNLTVAGVYKDLPENSTIKPHLLCTYDAIEPHCEGWKTSCYLTLTKLPTGFETKGLDNSLNQLVKEEYQTNRKIWFFPLKEAYIRLPGEPSKAQHIITIFFSGLLVLIVSLVNFINLHTAILHKKHNRRTIKSILGASTFQIVRETLLETFIYVSSASVLSFILSLYLLPSISAKLGLNLLSSIGISGVLLLYFTIAIIVFILATIYPAYTSVHSIRKKKSFRLPTSKYSVGFAGKYLITLQFIISIFIGITAFSMHKQLKYAITSDKGYDGKQVIYAQLWDYPFKKHQTAITEFLSQNTSVESYSIAEGAFNGLSSRTTGLNPPSSNDDEKHPLKALYRCDENLLQTMGLKMAAGRFFQPKSFNEKTNLIINETYAKMLGGVEHALNVQLGEKYKVVGVCKDIIFENFYNKVEPLVISYNDRYSNLLIKTLPNKEMIVIAELSKFLAEKSSAPFEINPVQNLIRDQYKDENAQLKLVYLFAILAIVVSCLGLLGMVILMITYKTKEIGIRKVNGAKVSEVLSMLNRDFLKWVVIAFLIAAPLSYYAMSRWLEGFAYRTELSWWIFALAGLIALAVALLTVSWQSWRAATRNPVEALRYE